MVERIAQSQAPISAFLQEGQWNEEVKVKEATHLLEMLAVEGEGSPALRSLSCFSEHRRWPMLATDALP